MLARVARVCYHHRRLVLTSWLLLFVAAVVGGGALAGSSATSGRLPGTDSQRAYDLLEKSFPAHAGDDGGLVFSDVQQHRAAIDALVDDVGHVPGVSVDTLHVAPDHHVAAAPLTIATGPRASPDTAAARVTALADHARAQGVQVELAGDRFSTGGMPSSEAIGLLAAIIVLLIAFGSVVAMGLPILSALLGIGIAIAGVGIAANVFTTPDFTAQVATMIGIGVGVDYALFIVTRYRDALHRTGSPEASAVEAISTSGRAVVFAGCTVVVSVLGMFLMGLDFLHGLAVGIAIAVVVAVAVAVTLLPALLGFVGLNIDRLHLGRRARRDRRGMWQRWAGYVQRRPAAVAAAGFAVLVVAALPALTMRMGSADAGNDPAASTTHKAYELVAQGFGPGQNGPIVVAIDAPTPAARAAMPALLEQVRRTPGVARVTAPSANPSGAVFVANVIPETGPQDAATTRLVHTLRREVVPATTAGTGLHAYLGGNTASSIDFTDVISARLPLFIAAVLAVSFVLLLIVFRSVLVPLKAVLMNLLSIAAAYGVIVAVFQWGWFGNLFGVSGGPIEPWVPMMLFAIVFGLSMDYEVFLLSSIRERYDRTGDNSAAVADGLASTARVITSAALIMAFVFGSFVLSDLRALKLIGLGLTVAVIIDATIVRVVLVPATMELLGKANWWLPERLRRFLPRVAVDGPAPVHAIGAHASPEEKAVA